MSLPLRLSFLILCIALCGLPTALFADFTGEQGRIVSFMHNSPGSDDYSLYRGAVVIKPWNGTAQEYRWGGSTCPGKELSIDEQAMLQRAFLAWRVSILPFYKNGQGGNLCLIGFELSRLKH